MCRQCTIRSLCYHCTVDSVCFPKSKMLGEDTKRIYRIESQMSKNSDFQSLFVFESGITVGKCTSATQTRKHNKKRKKKKTKKRWCPSVCETFVNLWQHEQGNLMS